MTNKMKQAVQDEICVMLKERPTDMILAILCLMGKQCVEANAATMDLKTEATVEGGRYEVKCKISVKKIKKILK